MKKIALVSVWNHNYGSLLQTFALQKYLHEHEFPNEIIFFKEGNKLKKGMRLLKYSFLMKKFKGFYRDVYTKRSQSKTYINLQLRAKKFEGFKTQHLSFTPLIQKMKDLNRIVKQYDTFILGSDQVWHPDNLRMNYFNLQFVPERKKKIAYAPSFGVSKIPFYQIKRTKKYLNRINHISVREKSGQTIVHKLTNRDVPIVCDPTILLEKKYWDELKGIKPIIDKKYIFCYFLGTTADHRRFANRLKDLTGYILVHLPHLIEFVKHDIDFGDIQPFDIGPAEFVNLIANAEFVLTDSFHGSVFSIIYEKIFFVFNRFEDNTNQSTNTRIETLLTTLNLEERKLLGNEQIENCVSQEIDYSKVNKLLSEFRENSEEYIINALNSL